ncbi:MAG: thioredoxin domain-containing protein, partial [Pseudomonadota bacterium]|nr:thioredoxin domain-containing protein [Pseudomonadota bacterium]
MLILRSFVLISTLSLGLFVGMALTDAVRAQDGQIVISAENADEPGALALTALIDARIRKTLVEHPDLVIQAIEAYQAGEQERQAAAARVKLTELEDQIKYDPSSPVIGNPDGSVTMVEFFDYNCGYCKRVLDDLLALVEKHDDLRVVFKEMPILGPVSVVVAKAALAAGSQ